MLVSVGVLKQGDRVTDSSGGAARANVRTTVLVLVRMLVLVRVLVRTRARARVRVRMPVHVSVRRWAMAMLVFVLVLMFVVMIVRAVAALLVLVLVLAVASTLALELNQGRLLVVLQVSLEVVEASHCAGPLQVRLAVVGVSHWVLLLLHERLGVVRATRRALSLPILANAPGKARCKCGEW